MKYTEVFYEKIPKKQNLSYVFCNNNPSFSIISLTSSVDKRSWSCYDVVFKDSY